MAAAEVAPDPGPASEPPPPVVVSYDPLTGIPPEFNAYLPPACDEYKKWKAAQGGGEPAPADAAAAGVAALSVGDAPSPGAAPPSAAAPADPPKPPKPPKGKKVAVQEVVLEVTTRGKKKCVTVINGLDVFGVKLAEAAKLLGKKFACGSSVTKNALEKDQIEVQGDVAVRAAELLLKTYADKGLAKPMFFVIEGKSKRRKAFDDEGPAPA